MVNNLNQTLGKKQILYDISFKIQKKSIVAFLGPNGAGKTTLLKTIIGLLKIKKSDNKKCSIFFDSQDITNYKISQKIDLGILYLPQHCSLFLQMNVLDNLKLIYKYHNYWQNIEKKKFYEKVDRWLEKTNLQNTKKQLAANLSGGQKRKLEIIRSILIHPKVIMLDEPFAGVDPKSIYELKKIFTDLSEQNITILISDHNVDQLLSIANLIYVIINGKIVTSGGIKEIIDNPYTKEMYLGKQFHSEISSKYLR